MPLFTIRRDLRGTTQSERDAAGIRAVVCALEYEDLRWIRSYWDEEAGVMQCYYEARDSAEVREHSLRASIPCDEVSEVVEVLPFGYMESARQAAKELTPSS
jgi:uncharacterized protein DUF4242